MTAMTPIHALWSCIVDTETLRWFQQVADGETVTDVAALHAVSQPGVSRALVRLEREIGTPLLAKSGRVLRLTEAGAVFKAHLDAALHSLDDGLAAVGELLDPETGTVSVVFDTSLGLWLVPGLIAGFRRAYPRVRFRLAQTHDAHSWDDALEGPMDVAITSQRPLDPAMTWQHVVSLPLALAVWGNHRLADREQVSVAEAAEDGFVMVGRDWALHDVTKELCRAAGFTPRVAFEGEDVPVVRGFVAAGLGVAVVPVTQAETRQRRASERLIPLTDSGALLEVGMVWSRERRHLPSANLFRRYVLDARAHHLR